MTAGMAYEALNHIANTGLDDTRMTTVGGVILRHLDRLPREGDSVLVEGITLSVLAMHEHRISRVRVSTGREAKGQDARQKVEQEVEQEGASGATGEMEP